MTKLNANEQTVVIQNMSLVDRIADRLKSSPIGELISEDEVFILTKAAFEKAFFAEREKRNPDKRSEFDGKPATVKIPSLMEEVMIKHVKESVSVVMLNYLKDRDTEIKEVMLKVVKETIEQLTISHVLNALISGLIKGPLESMQNEMYNSIHTALNERLGRS